MAAESQKWPHKSRSRIEFYELIFLIHDLKKIEISTNSKTKIQLVM